MGYRAGTERRYAPRMSSIFDLIAESAYSLYAGEDGEVTVGADEAVISWSCVVDAADPAGTVVITPGGAGQTAAALPTITVPPGQNVGDDLVLLRLGKGTVFTFTGTTAYVVNIAKRSGT